MKDYQKRLEHFFKILFIYHCYLEGWDIKITETNIKIKMDKDKLPNKYYPQKSEKFDTRQFMVHNHLLNYF